MSKKSNIISVVLIISLIILSTLFYRSNIDNELDESIEVTIYEVLNQQKHTIDAYIADNIELVGGISESILDIIGENSVAESQLSLAEYIHNTQTSLASKNIYILKVDGSIITDKGLLSDFNNFDFIVEHTSGKTYVSCVTASPFNQENSIFISTPVKNSQNAVIATAILELPIAVFQDLYITFFDNSSTSILVDINGMIIASNVSEGLTGTNISNQGEGFAAVEPELLDDSSNQVNFDERSGYISLHTDLTNDKVMFAPIENTLWTTIITVPESVISKNANSIVLNTTLLLLEILFILVVTWLRLVFISREHLAQVSKIAYYDELTGLINEKKFKLDTETTLKANKNKQYTIVKVDIINFKVVNKIFGYTVGNKIIQEVAKNSIATKNDGVLFTRVSADEFLIFADSDSLRNIKKIKELYETELNDKIRHLCGRTFKFRYSRYAIPIGETSADDIVDTITLTHSFCKNSNSTGIYDYDENLKNQLLHTAQICDKMHPALKNNEFKVYLQPKYNLKDNTICGAEALVRWQTKDEILFFPNSFIPIFEQEGFIVELDKYMLENVCKIINRFKESYSKEIPISINFSRMHMLNDNFTDEITEIVDRYNVPHNLIEIEMTETSMIENEDVFKSVFSDLHKRGFTLSMDDFGAGYSSLALLTELEFDVIKLDKSLLAEDLDSDNSKVLVIKTILNMSKQLNLKTVCEGIETIEQVKLLKDFGCDIAQGYYYAKPIPNEEFGTLLNPWQSEL